MAVQSEGDVALAFEQRRLLPVRADEQEMQTGAAVVMREGESLEAAGVGVKVDLVAVIGVVFHFVASPSRMEMGKGTRLKIRMAGGLV